jgi:Xaa-Pro aminopeptidase
MLLNKDRALAIMEERDVDALVATTPVNVYYLSDYGTEHTFHFAPWGLSCAVFARDDDIPATLLVQEWEVPHVSECPSWMPNLRVQTGVETYVPDGVALGPAEEKLVAAWDEGRKSGNPNRQRLLGATLVELGLGDARLAFDDVRVMLELQENELVDARVFDGTNLFREIRVIKTPEELVLLREAARMNQVALESVAALVRPGVSCGELVRHYRSTMTALGGYGSHMTGGGASHPWLTFPDLSYRLKEGDILHLDPAGHYLHYWADLGRTAVLGRPSARFEEFYGTLQEVHRVTDPMLQAGVSTETIRTTAREVAARSMPQGFLPLVHSIGIEQYDHPQSLGAFLSEDFLLEDGMTVNFETLYFELGWGMLQLEDTYVIGTGEPSRLASLAQEPFIRDQTARPETASTPLERSALA